MITEEQLTQYIQSIVDQYKDARENGWGYEEKFYGEELDFVRRLVKQLTGKSIRITHWKASLE